MQQQNLSNIIFDRELLAKRRLRALRILPKADFLIKRSFEDIREKIIELNLSFENLLVINEKNFIYEDLIASLSKNTKNITFSSELNPSDEEFLSLKPVNYELILSMLNIHNVNDLPGLLFKIQNSLKPLGTAIISLFGENNLLELRETLIKTEIDLFGGASLRVMPTIEIKQLGSLLQRAGFKSIIIDKDEVMVHYNSPFELLYDLRNMGETNIMLSRNKNYVGKKFWQLFEQNYRKKFSVSENEITAKFEILTLTARK